jgi:isopentenyl-diphosphate Delta-isomerase
MSKKIGLGRNIPPVARTETSFSAGDTYCGGTGCARQWFQAMHALDEGAWEMNDDAEQVILVDAHDRETGHAAKLAAHRQGLLHRAISVSVVDGQGRLLLQRRAREKYHSGGLWTNACCTHPRPGETTDDAAERRLAEELGVVCPLHWVLRTQYRAQVGVELVEHEVVHLYHGLYIGEIRPDSKEVEAFVWTSREILLSDLEKRPEDYTYWFKHYVRCFADRLFFGAAA